MAEHTTKSPEELAIRRPLVTRITELERQLAAARAQAQDERWARDKAEAQWAAENEARKAAERQLAERDEQVRVLREALNEVHLSAVQYKHRAKTSKVYSIGQFDWPRHFGFIAETARAALAASEPVN